MEDWGKGLHESDKNKEMGGRRAIGERGISTPLLI